MDKADTYDHPNNSGSVEPQCDNSMQTAKLIDASTIQMNRETVLKELHTEALEARQLTQYTTLTRRSTAVCYLGQSIAEQQSDFTPTTTLHIWQSTIWF